MAKGIKNKIIEEQERIAKEIKEKTIGYIITALGIVAGLAWNDAIKTTIEYVFPLDSNSVVAKILYALLVTILIVLVSVYLMRISDLLGKKKIEENKENEKSA